MLAQKERCPWCESEITRDKFEEIESRIRDEERERLGKHEAELKKRFEGEKKRELESQKHSIETQQRLESEKKITAIKSELQKSAKKVQELENQNAAKLKAARAEADKKLEGELAKVAEQYGKELDLQRAAQEKSRDAELKKLREELSKANADSANQIASITAERDGTREELKAVKAREADIRSEIEKAAQQEMKDRFEEFEQKSKKHREEASLAIAELTKQRDKACEEAKNAEERAKQIAETELEKLDSKHQAEIAELRKTLDSHRDQELLKQKSEFNREREGWQSKFKDLERQLEQKTANEIGDGAEIDLFERLREEFPDDKIIRIDKGKAGADVHHDVMYKGNKCGRLVYDSKKRQSWRSEYVTKLRKDQLDAGAEHAILTALKFPSGEKELCIQSDVIVVNPCRAVHVVEIIRKAMVQMHLLGLSNNERERKTGELYSFITSNGFTQRMDEASRLATDILDLDVVEKKAHDNVWKKRGITATRLKNVLREIDTDVSAIVEGAMPLEAPDNETSEPLLSSIAARLPR